MAGVPEIKAPSVQPEAMPAVPAPAPPPGAFGGAAIGAGLDDSGKALFGIGWESYHKAVVAFSQSKETQFQAQAQQAIAKYKTLFNWDAISTHDKITAELEKMRGDIEKTIPSKDGQQLYRYNSQRNLRILQGLADSHFEQQNRQFQEISYKDGQAVSTRMLASMAQGSGFNPTDVADKVQEIYKKAKDYATAHGLPEENAALHAQKEVGVSMDAYFDMLTDKHSGRSTQEIKDEFEKWNAKGYLSKHVQQKVAASGYAQEARSAVRGFFDGTPRLVNDPKFDGDPDPDGEPNIAAIQAKVGDYVRAHPDQEEAALHEYNALRLQVEGAYTQEVKRRVDRVVASTREDMGRPGPWNGVFHVDPTSRDYLWLLRNKATALDPIIRSEYTTDHRLQKTQHDANEKAFKADLIRLASEDPAKFEKLTEADLFKMQDDKKYLGGFDAHFQLEGAGKVLKGLKEQHQKNELGWIEKTVVSYLKSNIYTNKDEELQAHNGKLHDEIAIAMQEGLKAGTVKRDDWKSVHDFLTSETTKVGQSELWGYKFGGEYKAERDARDRAAKPAESVRPVSAEPPKSSAPHKILTIKRGDKDMKWDATDKKWVE